MSTENQDDTDVLSENPNSIAHTHMNVICHIQQSAASQWPLANFPDYYIIVIIIHTYIHTNIIETTEALGTTIHNIMILHIVCSYNYTAQSCPVLFYERLKWQHC